MTPTKLTNQLFVKSNNTTNNTNTLLNGDDSLGAATFVSVVSYVEKRKKYFPTSIVSRSFVFRMSFVSFQLYC